MFFATTAQPQLRRHAYANTGRALERFMEDALRSSPNKPCAYSQDETTFTLNLDVPGVSKEQLAIAIEGAVVHRAATAPPTNSLRKLTPPRATPNWRTAC
jgi:HSP20 family molecular chaperone IbpA